jgi:hypothetical protein
VPDKGVDNYIVWHGQYSFYNGEASPCELLYAHAPINMIPNPSISCETNCMYNYTFID